MYISNIERERERDKWHSYLTYEFPAMNIVELSTADVLVDWLKQKSKKK